MDPTQDELFNETNKLNLNEDPVETFFDKSKNPESRLLENWIFTVIMKNKDPRTLSTEVINFFRGIH
jgi:hypothetical protein